MECLTKRNKYVPGFLSLLLAASLLASCYLPASRPSGITPGAQDQINTAAAQTVAAMATRIAEGGNPTLGGFTPTPITPRPTITRTATVTPQPQTSTPASDEPCNQASFVSDVTIPDNTTIPPNTVFTKTWELKNIGSCAWTNAYSVVFAGRGSAMSAAAATPVIAQGEVKPGETARVSVTMRAPDNPGDYEGFWLLRDPNNNAFGTGENGASPFFIKIHVAEGYSFVEQWCSATWSSGAGELPCPGEEGDSRGYAKQIANPTLEDNTEHEGLGLLVVPQPVAGGYIVARFPPVIVPEQADFRATLGCQPGATGCYVRFKVTYKVESGDEQVLGEWNEGYEGGLTEAIRDLDMIAGKSAAFSLYVYVNGAPDQAKAIWFNPRITK